MDAILSSSSSDLWFAFPLLILMLTSTMPQPATSAPTYVHQYCPSSTTFSPNSTYQTNRASLLTTLAESNNKTVLDFRNTTIQNTQPMYGIYMCRGDVSDSTCSTCVSTAASTFPTNCPSGIKAISWYDECFIRYSNVSFLGDLDVHYYYYKVSGWNISGNATRFNEILGSTANDVAVQAANGDELRKFATKEVSYGDFLKLYVLGQCTPDLSQADCETCLKTGNALFPTCCSDKRGARIYLPSCYIRYEIFLFYNESWSAAPAPTTPEPIGNGTTSATNNRAEKKSSSSSSKAIVVGISVIGAVALTVLLPSIVVCLSRRRRRRRAKSSGSDFMTIESLQYDLATLKAATRNFYDDNKIGEGGFGCVYKGTLPDGQEIAVKRLSRTSGQGIQELKNEMVLVAKLQHRNLVRLLGFCLEDEEKLLVYEFVHNKSLDYFLFNPARQGELDWIGRYKIIIGIARGMLYLHEDSRFRIIHRDLKASNVLLDLDMSPKISDFGMARIFGEEQTHQMTSRVVGTYGYMPPEYALHGQFSVKSDVYSFGVLVLEIISGKRNTSFQSSDFAGDLVSYAWKLWLDGTPLELMDQTLRSSSETSEVVRCIHLALLCVQLTVEERPTMANIALTMNTHSITLPDPREPAYFFSTRVDQGSSSAADSSSSQSALLSSATDSTVSELIPR